MQNENKIDYLSVIVDRERKLYNLSRYLEERIATLERGVEHREFMKTSRRREVIMRHLNNTTLALSGGVLCGGLVAYITQSSNIGITGAECVGIGLAIPLLLKVNPKTIKDFRDDYKNAGEPEDLGGYLRDERMLMFAKMFYEKILALMSELNELKTNYSEEDILLFEEKTKKYTITYTETVLHLLGVHAMSSKIFYSKYLDGTLKEYLAMEGYDDDVIEFFYEFMKSYHGSLEDIAKNCKK